MADMRLWLRFLRSILPKKSSSLSPTPIFWDGGAPVFPAGLKWKAVADNAPHPRYIITNIDEMEPGTFKDRMLTHADPHMIIEGTILAGYAVSAEKGFLFVGLPMRAAPGSSRGN